MNDDFDILVEFLDRLGPEVSGRVLSEPHPEAAVQIGRFGRGECKKEERIEVCEMLRLHPAWVRWLADRVRHARLVPDAAEGSLEGN